MTNEHNMHVLCLLFSLLLGSASVAHADGAASACGVVERISTPRAGLPLLPSDGDLSGLQAHRIEDGFAFLPRPRSSSRAGVLRIARDGAAQGFASSTVFGDAFALAGSPPAAQLLVMRAFRAAHFAPYDPGADTLGAPQTFGDPASYVPRILLLATAPARDGRNSVFAVGTGVLGPLDVGVVGSDAVLAAPTTRVCKNGQSCACVQILPTETGGVVSFLEIPKNDYDDTRWRNVTLDAGGKVVADEAVGVLDVYGCPGIAQTHDGLVARVLTAGSGLMLVPFEHPERSRRLEGSGSGAVPLAALAGDGPDLLLLDDSTPSVARLVGNVFDDAARFVIEGARSTLALPSDGDGMRIAYTTDTSLEIVKVSCQR